MTPQQIRQKFMHKMSQEFSALDMDQVNPLIAENLLSPFKVSLPTAALEQAKSLAKVIFKLRQNNQYQESYQSSYPMAVKPKNNSILMSYDFHWNGKELKLIEVNTNAAFMGLGWYMTQSHELPSPVPDFTLFKLKSDIENEVKLQRGTLPNSLKIAIVDQQPDKQRLYVEFLLYRELFKSWGWSCDILDVEDTLLLDSYDFIYNRHTDFYFGEPVSSRLKNIFENQLSVISPHPYEYHLLANKERMQDWNDSQKLDQWGVSTADREILKKHVPRTFDVSKLSTDEVWAQRKQLFFKPKSAFGSKQSYKGESISKKIFGDITNGDFIAQELVSPAEIEGVTDSGPQNFKYDLRFYAYQADIEFVVARIYQGQVTNLKTLWGGFAPVEFKD